MCDICPKTRFIFEDLAKEPETPQLMSDVVKRRTELVKEISAEISIYKSEEIADGKLSASGIAALAETISRVPIERYEDEKEEILAGSPEQIYAWAMSNSNVVYPYLCLAQAEKHILTATHASVVDRHWGMKDGVFTLPKIESVSLSNAWILLFQLAHRLNDGKVKHSYDVDVTVPDLNNDDIVKDPMLETIFLRLLEVDRSPDSVTIRTGTKLSEKDMAKNLVDFVILDKLYQRDKDSYKNLMTAGLVTSKCRRTEKVEKHDGDQITIKRIYSGYKLSDITNSLVTKRVSKTEEYEPFTRFIIDICELLSHKISDTFTIPRGFFMTPSIQLRSRIRRGPKIKTKSKKERTNLYIPFSFAKSKECSLIPETIKKAMVDVGSEVIKSLDTINKLPVKEANDKLELYERYITACYRVSDECRKKWRLSCFIPQIENFKQVFNFSEYPVEQTVPLELVDRIEREGLTLRFIPFVDNPEEMNDARRFISELQEAQKKNRLANSSS